MGDVDDQRRVNGESLLSRRELLGKTTYGLGATLAFGSAFPNFVSGSRDDTRSRAPAVTSAGKTTRKKPAIYRARLSARGQPRSVCKGDAGVLVVGATDDGAPVSWLTSDGSVWLEQGLSPPAEGEADLWGVAARAGQYIAVGSILRQLTKRIRSSGGAAGDHMDVTFTDRRRLPTVWLTKDCVTWSGEVLGDVVDAHAQLTAVACDGRTLVAVGGMLDADSVQGSAGLVLRSGDGQTWQVAEVAGGEAAFTEGSFTAVAAARGRWYATSTNLDGGTVWTSDDGARWTPARSSVAAFRRTSLQGIGVRHKRVYVAGTPFAEPAPQYFVSSDGCRSWEPATLDLLKLSGADASVHDLTVISGDVVVVGTHRGVPVIEGGELDGRH